MCISHDQLKALTKALNPLISLSPHFSLSATLWKTTPLSLCSQLPPPPHRNLSLSSILTTKKLSTYCCGPFRGGFVNLPLYVYTSYCGGFNNCLNREIYIGGLFSYIQQRFNIPSQQISLYPSPKTRLFSPPSKQQSYQWLFRER